MCNLNIILCSQTFICLHTRCHLLSMDQRLLYSTSKAHSCFVRPYWRGGGRSSSQEGTHFRQMNTQSVKRPSGIPTTHIISSGLTIRCTWISFSSWYAFLATFAPVSIVGILRTCTSTRGTIRIIAQDYCQQDAHPSIPRNIIQNVMNVITMPLCVRGARISNYVPLA